MKKIITILISLFLLVSCNTDNQETEAVVDITKTGEKIQILALGDSLTAGYNLDISESYPSQLEKLLNKNGDKYEITNAGVSGDTSKNLISRLNLYNETYDIVLLNIGGNDALRSLNLADLKSNIIKTIDTYPNSKIVLFSIDIPMNYGFKYRGNLEKVYEEISDEKDVYFYGLFFEGLSYHKHFLNDGLHPNTQGYEIIAENINKYLIKNKLVKND